MLHSSDGWLSHCAHGAARLRAPAAAHRAALTCMVSSTLRRSQEADDVMKQFMKDLKQVRAPRHPSGIGFAVRASGPFPLS